MFFLLYHSWKNCTWKLKHKNWIQFQNLRFYWRTFSQWSNHDVVNLVLTLLDGYGIYLQSKNKKIVYIFLWTINENFEWVGRIGRTEGIDIKGWNCKLCFQWGLWSFLKPWIIYERWGLGDEGAETSECWQIV